MRSCSDRREPAFAMPAEDDDLSSGKESAPEAWQILLPSELHGPVMIIGGPDTGKSTLAHNLIRQLRREGRSPALLDADPGQGSLGPPTTLGLRIGASSATKSWFVGATSPSGHMLDQLTGMVRLAGYARERGADPIMIDTCGLIDRAAGGHALKWAEFQLLQPSVVIALQRNGELDDLMAAFRAAGKRVESFAPTPAVRQRDQQERARQRQETYHRYFEGAKDLPLDRDRWPNLRTTQGLHKGRLLGLLEPSGFLLGLGLLLEGREGRLLVRTPLASLADVSHVSPGDVLVDVVSFRDRRDRP